MGSRDETPRGVWWCSYHPHISRVTSWAELMGPPAASVPDPTLPQRSVEKWSQGEPLLPTDRGAPSSWGIECPTLKHVPSPEVAFGCGSPLGSGADRGLAGQEGSRASAEAASITFYSKRKQVDTDPYLLQTCFLNFINSVDTVHKFHSKTWE